jgi:hypothetical protein
MVVVKNQKEHEVIVGTQVNICPILPIITGQGIPTKQIITDHH